MLTSSSCDCLQVQLLGVCYFVYGKTRTWPPMPALQALRTSLLACRNKFWAGIRAACEPMFQSKMLRTYTPLMHRSLDKLLDKLEQHKGPINAGTTLGAMTIEVIGGTAFG